MLTNQVIDHNNVIIPSQEKSAQFQQGKTTTHTKKTDKPLSLIKVYVKL